MISDATHMIRLKVAAGKPVTTFDKIKTVTTLTELDGFRWGLELRGKISPMLSAALDKREAEIRAAGKR